MKRFRKWDWAYWLLISMIPLVIWPGRMLAQGIMPPNFDYLLDSWSFDDTNWASDLGDGPVSFTNLNNPPGIDGNALQVDSTNAAWLQYNVFDGIATNLTFDKGTIELWVLPDWNSGVGPNDWGRLIDVGAYSTNSPSSWWSLYFSPDGSAINFSSEANGVFTNYFSYPILWDTNTWHLVDLTYEFSRAALYIDGQLATNSEGRIYFPDAGTVSNSFYVGSDVTGWQQSRALIDDLATYSYPLGEYDVSNDYVAVMGVTLSGGFGPDDDGGLFPGTGGGDGGGSGFTPGFTPPDYGTNLWLEMTNGLNSQASGWVHNSTIFVPYTIFSKQSLLWPVWNAEVTLYGSWITNFTPFSVPMLARSNLFLQARSEIAPHIVGAGNAQFATLRRDGTVWTWGDGSGGQLGNGQWTNSATPVQVTGISNVVAIVAPCTGDYDLALDAYGDVWSWGTNEVGQLGRDDGLYEDENTPAIVPGLSNIVAIAGGSGHAIALKSDGTVWAWGDNAYGDLGDSTGIERDYAAPVPGLTNAIAIVSGDSHCFAIDSDGKVWGWGLNEDWELGIGNADDQWSPVIVTNLTNAVALSGGYDFSVAQLSNGTIEAWGANYYGEIGDISSSTPVPVAGLSNIVSIASGGSHSLFINTNGNVFAWGWDWFGQFGDGGANYGSTDPYLLVSVSNVTAIAGGNNCSIVSTGNGNIYTFGDSYEMENAPTLTDLYTNYSSDGSGLPDWWELQYFYHLGLDPNSDPVGDGWSLLQDYEQGFNPTNFIEPPAITGLTVVQTNVLGSVILTWNAEVPAPLDYVIYRMDYNYDTWQYGPTQQIGEVTGGITSFTDNGSVPGGDQNSVYQVDGIYGGGGAPFSAQAYVNSYQPSTLTDNLPFTAALVRNGTGRWQIMFSGLPSGLQTVQLSWQSNSGSATQDISVSNIVNGSYFISDGDVLNDLGTTLYVRAIGPGDLFGESIYAGVLPDDAPYFVNGQQHMEQNLKFLIRGAWLTEPFAHSDGYLSQFNQYNTNYEEFSFLHHTWISSFPEVGQFFTLDNLWPFKANYTLSQSLADTSRINGDISTPFGTNIFNFEPNFSTNVPAPPILGQADPYWILQPLFGSGNGAGGNPYGDDGTNWGLTFNPDYTEALLQSGNNLFGLSYEDGLLVSDQTTSDLTNTYDYQDLPPNVPVATITNYSAIYYYASWCPAPTLQFTNYYVATVIDPSANAFSLPPNLSSSGNWNMFQPYPLPIEDDYDYFDDTIGPGFSVTNQTPAVMFGSVGQPMILGAWAKYVIQGSSPTKYAYLGQYFTTNAYEINIVGDITTTNAGIVSPYGEFFPMQPGPVALITMTNLDTGTQATGIVNIISLALDANHDGTIDPTWNGPDFTSPSRPYVFWCNNNFDRWEIKNVPGLYDDVEQDDVQAGDTSYPSRNLDPNDPDCNYVTNGSRVIPDTRDLEDFARLWVCGLTSEAVSNLPAGSTVTLSWGDAGNPNPNNPTIDIFQAGDPDGGTEYLTNETSAQIQVDPSLSPYVGRIGPGGSLQLSAQTLVNGSGGNCFIWCGVSNGIGGLALTIFDPHSNVLARTSAYIQIVDIKQMYERWTLGDDSSEPPLTTPELATNDLPAGILEPFRYANPAAPNTPYILHVHGYNMEPWVKDRFAETEFKRLYWQGYQGRFGELRWPTTVQGLQTQAFDISENQAWNSGLGLLKLLAALDGQYSGNVYLTAHSHGNVVAGQALELATQEGAGQVVDAYIAMQAAADSHAYDPTTPTRGYAFSTPDRYGQYYTNGAANYFYGSAGAGTYVNFFNTNDFALTTLWEPDQNDKPDIGYEYYSDPDAWWETTISGVATTELFFPTNTDTIFAFIDQGHAYALGAQSDVAGPFQKGTNYNQVFLPSVWPSDTSGGNYGAHIWHSAEFRSDYPQRWQYWEEVLIKMGLKEE